MLPSLTMEIGLTLSALIKSRRKGAARIVNGEIQPSLLDLVLGDMNSDDTLNVEDLLLLQQTLLNSSEP